MLLLLITPLVAACLGKVAAQGRVVALVSKAV